MNQKGGILSGTPLLPLVCAFMGGVALARIFPEYTLTGAAVMVALCFLGLLTRRFLPVVCCAGAGLGLMAMAVAAPVRVGTGKLLSWRVEAERTRSNGFNQELTVRVLSPKCYAGGRMFVTVKSPLPPVNRYDILEFKAVADTVAQKAAIPYEYSSGENAYIQGVTACVTLRGQRLEEHLHANADTLNQSDFTLLSPSGLTPGMMLLHCREALSEAIICSGVAPEAAYFLDAVLTGNKASLDPALRTDFGMAGVSHVLALSGTHVAVMVMFLWIILFPVRMTGHIRTELLLMLIALWTYALITGLSPSVCRAAIMVTAVLTARMLGRESQGLNSLCLAALLILLVEPRQLFDIGFQLSFAAVAGILLFMPLIGPRHVRNPWLRIPWNWVAVSIAATLTTAPLVAWHFHQFPLYFLLANIPVCLILPWMMGGELLLLMLNLAGISAPWLVGGINHLFSLVTTTVEWVNTLPSALLYLWISPWLLIPWTLALAALWMALSRQRLSWAIATLLLTGFTVALYRIDQSRTPTEELLPVPDSYNTIYLYRRANHCYLLTDASPNTLPTVSYHLTRRASLYLLRHSIDSLEFRPLPPDTIAFPRLVPPEETH